MEQRKPNYRRAQLEWLERRELLSVSGGTCEPTHFVLTHSTPAVEFESTLDSQLHDEDELTVRTFGDVLYDPQEHGPLLDRAQDDVDNPPSPDSNFSLAGWRWPDSRVPVGYYINTTILPSGVNEADYISAVENSFQSWENIPTTTMRFFRLGSGSQYGTGSGDGVTTVGFGTAVPGALAHATTYSDGLGVTEFDVVLGDDRGSWSANPGGPGGGQVDVWATTTHEIGHGLGLGHSGDSNASMYFAIFIGSTHQRVPNGDDVAGLEQLYLAPTNQPPSAPGSITASDISDSQATVSWDPSSDPEGNAITYELQYRKDDLSTDWSGSLITSSTSSVLSTLESEVTYRVRVRASDGLANSDWTEAAGLFTTLSTNQPPTAPGLAGVTHVTARQARLVWGVSSDPDGDAISYDVQFRKDDLTDDWSSSLVAATTSSTINGLQSDETYRVRVRAVDGQASSEWTESPRLLTTRPSVPTYQVGEVGIIANLTHETQIIALSSNYENPVVFAQSPSIHGVDSAVVRVSNVQSSRFSIYLAEPSNLNGFHNAAETVSYVVLEAGSHQLADGTRLEVGQVDTAATAGLSSGEQWENINWNTNFNAPPVVLTQIQSAGGQAYLNTRQDAIGTDGFRVALEQEEAIDIPHAQETVGYLAVEEGTGAWNELFFEARTAPTIFTDVSNNLVFQQSYEQPPAFLSSLASYHGSDSAGLRYANLGENGVELKVDEDTTADIETGHTNESVAYLAIGGTGPLTAVLPQENIGEVGRITTLTHVPQTIVLEQSYSNPVVFVQSPSIVGVDVVAARVTDVVSNRFTVFLAEPSNLNGFHNAQESITYLVMEAGEHRLSDGTLLEVQTIETTATVGKIVENQWENVSFESEFDSAPVLLSQIQTTDGQGFLHTRQNTVTANGFQIALEQEEAIDTQHAQETIGYLAVESGSAVSGDIVFEAMSLRDAVTDLWSVHSFDRVFDSAPYFLSSLSSYQGSDNAHLRYDNLDQNAVQLKIGEDTTRDTETAHLEESVSYLAIGGVGTLTALAAQDEIGEVGRITNLTHAAQTIVLQRELTNPVVFAQSATSNGNDPVAVRVTDVQSDRFTIRLVEPSNENGFHNAQETVTYLVVEAGTHRLPDGRRLEARTVVTSATVGQSVVNQWLPVFFDSPFDSTPVVLSQIQSNDGQGYLQTRQLGIGSSRFQVALEQEEAISTGHGPETIGVLAIEAGIGLSGALVFEAGYTTNTINNGWTSHSFERTFDGAPHFLSSLSSYFGPDNAHVRYANLDGNGVQLKIGEDTTFDLEIGHTQETVAYLALSGAGIITAIPPSPQNVAATSTNGLLATHVSPAESIVFPSVSTHAGVSGPSSVAPSSLPEHIMSVTSERMQESITASANNTTFRDSVDGFLVTSMVRGRRLTRSPDDPGGSDTF